MTKIVMCVKHGTILFSNMGVYYQGVCDKCRSEKIDKVLRRDLKERIKERIKEWWNG